jgi:hypothetical protein
MPRRLTLLSASALAAALVALGGAARGGPNKSCAVCVRENVVTPLDGFFTNPCTNEQLGQPEGELHTIYSVSVDGDGAIHVESHDNVQGGSAVGMTTGARYVFNEAGHLNTNNIALAVDPVGGRAAEGTFVHYVAAISPGSGDNFFIRVQQHLTIDANGVTTVLQDGLTTECR